MPEFNRGIAVSDFFILGCSRSGTTMFASLLNNHPLIAVPPETWWLGIAQQMGTGAFYSRHLLDEFLRRVINTMAHSGQEDWLRFMEKFSQRHKLFMGSYSDLFDKFAAEAKVEFHKSTFGEKTPAHTTYSTELNVRFSSYKKIVLLRDPRDIVSSYFDAWYSLDIKSLYTILLTIKNYLHYIVWAYIKSDYLFVKYETLTLAPEVELARVSKYLGLPDFESPYMLNPTISTNRIHVNLNKPVFNNSGKYLKKLPAHYIAAIEAVLGDEIRMLGYSCAADNGQYREFVANFLPIIAQSARQIQEESVSKNSLNWHPTFRTQVVAMCRSIQRDCHMSVRKL